MSLDNDWMVGGERRTMETFLRVETMASDVAEIKGSLKEMATAISKLAIVEERQAQDRSAMDRIFKELVGHETRIKTIELAQPLQKQTTDWFSRIIWVVVSAVLAGILSLVIADRTMPRIPHAGLIEHPQVLASNGGGSGCIGGGSGDISQVRA